MKKEYELKYWMEFIKKDVENIIYLNAFNNKSAYALAVKIADAEGINQFNIKYLNRQNGTVVEVITERLKGLNHEYRI